MTQRRFVIAGTGSGAGKTTFTIGLMAALRRRGLIVQGFKCGPDYIDPSYHTAVTGRASRNLDSWMLSHDLVKEIFVRGCQGADISVIEGVMGMFDGKNPESNEGSTAEIAAITQSPVILVVNCHSMARTAAAIVKGFQCFSSDVHIAGVLLNQVGSEKHYEMVKIAVEQECGIPVIGYLKREEDIFIPERHLGLVPSIERGELAPLFDKLADLMEESIDLDLLLHICESPLIEAKPKIFVPKPVQDKIRIAVAKDAAFNFYYPENLELLEAYGAECINFSPLAGECVPEDAAGLYIGGGFPEEFASQLCEQEKAKESVKKSILSGMPTLAECGGYMYLTEAIEARDGETHPMVGCIPGKVKMQQRLAALGYREITGCPGNFLLGDQDTARGHEFHYSVYIPGGPVLPAYSARGLLGTRDEGFLGLMLVAGYTHIHFASNPQMVHRWLSACKNYIKEKPREAWIGEKKTC
jgi:cobyrinic acid a,c-diamide synthase